MTSPPNNEPETTSPPAASAADGGAPAPVEDPAANRDRMAAAPPARRSVWTPKQKLVRLLWGTVGRLPWWLLPPARPALLRLFGARVGRGCRFARNVEITIPWHLDIGDGVEVGPGAILYGLGPIAIGARTVIDFGAHLCAGSHDMRDTRFPLTRPPIKVGAGCFVGIDAYIAPGVTLGDRVVVWHRASVYRDVPAGTTVRGNPAHAVDAFDAIGGDE